MAHTSTPPQDSPGDGQSRRDFLLYATTAVGVTGTGLALWPFIHSLNPSADTLAMSTTEVDLTPIAEGQAITVTWRGKPVFIRHRTAAEIASARDVKLDELREPEADDKRVKKPEWLILVGICTHLGCIPLGQKASDPRGEYGGWYCPCHGSVYDTSGRIRQGPAPSNLAVPSYTFLSDTSVRIG
ncbi:MAG TPA: ubiquinol-cytochrome c reductase iron-sulfur subunit [Rhodospirillaceae bacterium]|nr:ubiquinol-cytochrome c reductase iron-sulfur subunit [Rhodospirillaceae bacterium]